MSLEGRSCAAQSDFAAAMTLSPSLMVVAMLVLVRVVHGVDKGPNQSTPLVSRGDTSRPRAGRTFRDMLLSICCICCPLSQPDDDVAYRRATRETSSEYTRIGSALREVMSYYLVYPTVY